MNRVESCPKAREIKEERYKGAIPGAPPREIGAKEWPISFRVARVREREGTRQCGSPFHPSGMFPRLAEEEFPVFVDHGL
ncbi:MAG TPA: hypothetical protein PLV50_14155, partial [Smithella sp.]|nr:hypothetical protein [Smithella sp.]